MSCLFGLFPSFSINQTNKTGRKVPNILSKLNLNILSYRIPYINNLPLLQIKIITLNRIDILQYLTLFMHQNLIFIEIHSIYKLELISTYLLLLFFSFYLLFFRLPHYLIWTLWFYAEIVDVWLLLIRSFSWNFHFFWID